MLQFIIYGAGYRGKRLLHCLGEHRIAAFIDSNTKKQGQKLAGKPIMPLDSYIKCYAQMPIIISPSNSTSIKQALDNHGIYHYSILSELPSEFSGYGLAGFDDCYKGLTKKYSRPCYLYGINAFSLLLFDELRKRGNDVYFLRDKERMVSWAEKYAPEYIRESPTENSNVFLCRYTDRKTVERQCKMQNLIDAFDYTSNLPMYYNGKLENLKNAYWGKKRCFIVATGPSLRENDLQMLKQHGTFCFGVNKIFKMESDWIPDAYVVTDSFLLQEKQEEIAMYNAHLKFIGDGNAYGDDTRENTYIIHVAGFGHGNILPPFSADVAQKVYGAGTVVYACIQIAVYLGFREIYLLGVDCNYIVGSASNHFYTEGRPDMIERDMGQMILAFQAARHYAGRHGIKIYNATRGGKLEVFERVDFDRLF